MESVNQILGFSLFVVSFVAIYIYSTVCYRITQLYAGDQPSLSLYNLTANQAAIVLRNFVGLIISLIIGFVSCNVMLLNISMIVLFYTFLVSFCIMGLCECLISIIDSESDLA